MLKIQSITSINIVIQPVSLPFKRLTHLFHLVERQISPAQNAIPSDNHYVVAGNGSDKVLPGSIDSISFLMYKELCMLGIHDLALFIVSGLLLNMMPGA